MQDNWSRILQLFPANCPKAVLFDPHWARAQLFISVHLSSSDSHSLTNSLTEVWYCCTYYPFSFFHPVHLSFQRGVGLQGGVDGLICLNVIFAPYVEYVQGINVWKAWEWRAEGLLVRIPDSFAGALSHLSGRSHVSRNRQASVAAVCFCLGCCVCSYTTVACAELMSLLPWQWGEFFGSFTIM